MKFPYVSAALLLDWTLFETNSLFAFGLRFEKRRTALQRRAIDLPLKKKTKSLKCSSKKKAVSDFVECGDELVTDTRLERDLRCSNEVMDLVALTVNGAILDCGGNAIFGEPRLRDAAEGTAIIVKNGGKVMNCVVDQFKYGIVLEGGDNIVENVVISDIGEYGLHITGNGNNLIDCASIIQADDCYRVEGSGENSFTEIQAIECTNDGMIFESTAIGKNAVEKAMFAGNGGDGIEYGANGTSASLSIEDTFIFLSENAGILAGEDARGKITVKSTKNFQNKDDGIV